jgi:uncharacterized repeat protein (TIGR03803 family)
MRLRRPDTVAFLPNKTLTDSGIVLTSLARYCGCFQERRKQTAMKLKRHAETILVATLAALTMLAGVANAKDGAYRVIYNFKGSTDGWGPMGVPAVAKNGDLYGVTVGGGTSNLGTVFKVTAPQTRGGAWKKTVLYNFTSGEAEILTSLVMGKDGTLYGAGYNENYPGFIFRLKPPVGGDGSDGDWQYDVLYTFSNDSGGIFVDGIALDAKGDIYGTTEYGGDLSCGDGIGCGTVFELQRPTKRGGQWVHSVLYMFGQGGNEDAVEPFGGVTLDQNGDVYGTAAGGAFGYGTVYGVSPPTQKGGVWTETVLYSFDPGTNMGSGPDGPVTFDESGNIYGTTTLGGDLNCQGGYGCGVVFELSPQEGGTWTYANLYSFTDGDDGGDPESGLLFDGKGNLYGTSSNGNYPVAGCAFRLTPPTDGGGWTETTLHSFTGNDGAAPARGLAWGKWHNLYGVTSNGGTDEAGTVIELQP